MSQICFNTLNQKVCFTTQPLNLTTRVNYDQLPAIPAKPSGDDSSSYDIFFNHMNSLCPGTILNPEVRKIVVSFFTGVPPTTSTLSQSCIDAIRQFLFNTPEHTLTGYKRFLGL